MGMKNVCGIWKRKTKTNKLMLTGFDIAAIQQLDPNRDDLLLFVNERKKEGSKEPDFQLVVVEKKEPQQRQAPPQRDDDPFSF